MEMKEYITPSWLRQLTIEYAHKKTIKLQALCKSVALYHKNNMFELFGTTKRAISMTKWKNKSFNGTSFRHNLLWLDKEVICFLCSKRIVYWVLRQPTWVILRGNRFPLLKLFIWIASFVEERYIKNLIFHINNANFR